MKWWRVLKTENGLQFDVGRFIDMFIKSKTIAMPILSKAISLRLSCKLLLLFLYGRVFGQLRLTKVVQRKKDEMK
jgi:hypothetical protein